MLNTSINLGKPVENQPSSFQIWNAANSDEAEQWATLWEVSPQREIYAHPHYVKLYTNGEQSHAVCAAWWSSTAFVFYPFILRDLTFEPYWSSAIGPAFDLVTPYGYGGAYVWGKGDQQAGIDQSAIAAEFWKHFDTWIAQNAVVCEFVRLTLFQDTVLKYSGEQEEKQKNIVRSLDLSEDELWADFKHKVRKNVNRAQRSGVSIELDPTGDRLDDFFYLYEATMQRRHASQHYYFPRHYFEQINQTLAGQFMYFHAIHNGKVISTELVLISANTVYSFLGGTDCNSFDLRPNDLLKYEMIRWAKKAGKQQVVLGGGYEPEDGIYQYKLAFAPHGIMPFGVGHRIFQPGVYNQLVNNKIAYFQSKGLEWTPASGYFPQYRA